MPWENNGGGGRGNNGGPWGQIPGGGGGGPRRPGGTPPNLEDLLSKGRDRFQGGLPGGGGWIAAIAILVLGGIWISQSVYQVASDELGVEMRFGQPKEELSQEGLHFLFWPVERVEKVSILENQTRVASISSSRAASTESQMLTGDQNIVDVSFSILWRVNDPKAYLFNVREPAEMVRRAAESAMREVVGRRPAQDIFRDDRSGVAAEVLKITQGILASYDSGVAVSEIAIENAAPPAEVADAFDEVQRAEQDEDRFQEQARADANTRLGSARGQAAQILEEAAAYKNRIVQEAEGEAQRFVSVYEEYAKAPDVTRSRIYLETLEGVLGNSNKIIMEDGASGSGVVPYLPLNELRNNSQGAQ